jgi:hypothetical protein
VQHQEGASGGLRHQGSEATRGVELNAEQRTAVVQRGSCAGGQGAMMAQRQVATKADGPVLRLQWGSGTWVGSSSPGV